MYNEKKVYLVAETAASLSSMFAEQNHYLNFKNPVLRAFSTAVWNCSSAAQVAVVLNEAIASDGECVANPEIERLLAAARSNNGEAQYDLGLTYLNGYGVQRNFVEAYF